MISKTEHGISKHALLQLKKVSNSILKVSINFKSAQNQILNYICIVQYIGLQEGMEWLVKSISDGKGAKK